jgi:hypothetical protein
VYSGELEDSAVGYSYWTSSEKEALFRRLSRCTSADLRILSNAVATKSGSEVFMYLNLLQDGSVESHEDPSLEQLDRPTDDAAWEISSECEEALDAAADALARHISKHDITTEQTRYGNDWLLSQDSAAEVDRRYEEHEIVRSFKEEDSTCDAKKTTTSNDETPGNVLEPALSSMDELLRSSQFLALSRTVFMNSAEGESWHTMDDIVGPSQEPAMYRSAFEKFHELALTFTRRLCLTTLTQTASRLRSHAAEHPVAVVTAEDVRTACSILNVPPTRDEYWAACPRRCQLKIYSNADKYNDGRDAFYPPGSHRLARFISHHEAEKELKSEGYDGLQDDEGTEGELCDDDLNAALHGEEFFTDASDNSNGEMKPEGDHEQSDGINDEARRRRARSVTQRKYVRLEEDFLNATDLQSSNEEVQRLWRLLRLLPSKPLPGPKSRPMSLPRGPPDLEPQSVDWRQKMRWMTPWEHADVLPGFRAFLEVEQRGRAKRKHRETLKKRLQDRLMASRVETSSRAEESSNHADGGSTVDSDNLDFRAAASEEPS